MSIETFSYFCQPHFMNFIARNGIFFQWSERFFSFLLKNRIVWLLWVFAGIQLIGIMDPPLEIAHSWRQSFTAMVTRNYVEFGMDWLHPRINMAGEKTGIVGAEFPIFNFLSWLLCKAFGFQHWYGRFVNLIVVIFGAFHLYAMLKRIFSERIAFHTIAFLLCSSWFTFSRKIMPDTFSVSLVFIGLRYGYDFIFSGRFTHWLISVVFIALGVLSKIPALSLLAIAVVIPFSKDLSRLRKWLVILGLFLAVIPGFWWYFVWVPYLNVTYGYHLFFPKGLIEGWHEIVPLWQLLLEKFYFTSLYSFLGLSIFLFGFVRLHQWNWSRLNWALLSVTVIFGLFILKTGAVFPQHTYYSIPFVPVMCLMVSFGLEGLMVYGIKPRWLSVLAILICVESISNQFHDHFIKDSEKYKQKLENDVGNCIPQNAKIVMVSSANPQELYLIHRSGWTVFPEQVKTEADWNRLRNLGAQYVVINEAVIKNSKFEDAVIEQACKWPMIFGSGDYLIFKLR